MSDYPNGKAPDWGFASPSDEYYPNGKAPDWCFANPSDREYYEYRLYSLGLKCKPYVANSRHSREMTARLKVQHEISAKEAKVEIAWVLGKYPGMLPFTPPKPKGDDVVLRAIFG